jgi:hypothetical protein
MQCSECGSEAPEGATECRTCGAELTVTASSPIDRIADDAAQAVHDVVRAVQSVQRVGTEVRDAGRAVAATASSSKNKAEGVWKATKSLVGEAGREGSAAGRKLRQRAARSTAPARRKVRAAAGQVRVKGHRVERKVRAAGRHVERKVRTAARRVRRTTSR